MNELSAHRFRRLTKREKAIYENLKEQLLAHTAIARITDLMGAGTRLSGVSAVIKALRALHLSEPILYFVDWQEIFSCVRSENGGAWIEVPYLYTIAERKKIDKELEKIVGQFSKIKDERELALRVHDYLANTVAYDDRETENGIYRYRNHSIVGALLAKKAVCEGISKAYQFILNRYGVDCTMVTGRTRNLDSLRWDCGMHGWNIIRLGGENYHVDVTWDLARDWGDERAISYAYYCVSTEMISCDHEYKNKSIPCNSVKENLFFRAGRVFDDEKKLYAFLKKKKREKKGSFVMIRGLDDNRVNAKILAWSVRFLSNSVSIKSNMGIWYIRFGKAKKEKKVC